MLGHIQGPWGTEVPTHRQPPVAHRSPEWWSGGAVHPRVAAALSSRLLLCRTSGCSCSATPLPFPFVCACLLDRLPRAPRGFWVFDLSCCGGVGLRFGLSGLFVLFFLLFVVGCLLRFPWVEAFMLCISGCAACLAEGLQQKNKIKK